MAKQINCFVCGRENLSVNEIGLNKKLLGRTIKQFHCMTCLADYLEISIEDLTDCIQQFKDEGCVLFK